MRKIRLYYDEKPLKLDQVFTITTKNEMHHYLLNVMRVKKKWVINVFNNHDGEYEAVIEDIQRDGIKLRCIDIVQIAAKMRPLHLIISLCKRNTLSKVMQQAVELGVTDIHPIITEYSIAGEFNSVRYIKIIKEASEQSERINIATLHEVKSLSDIITQMSEYAIYFCDEEIADPMISAIGTRCEKDTMVPAVLIGPEGGFSPQERDMLYSYRYVLPISLGKNVLRLDTAAVVAIYCIKEYHNHCKN